MSDGRNTTINTAGPVEVRTYRPSHEYLDIAFCVTIGIAAGLVTIATVIFAAVIILSLLERWLQR